MSVEQPTTESFTAALAGLDEAVRFGGDPTQALRTLDTILSGPPPSAAQIRALLGAVAGLASTWVRASEPMLTIARAEAGAQEATPDLVERLTDITRRRVADAAIEGDVQIAVDALLLGGAMITHAGGDGDVLLPLLARLETTFGGDAVDQALDASPVVREDPSPKSRT